jgi:hypothetical protein
VLYGRGVDARGSSVRDCGCYVATGLWLFVTGLFFRKRNQSYVVSGGWLIGLGGDQLWRDFVAPFLALQEG